MLYGLDPASGEVVAERRLRSEHAGVTAPPVDADKYALKNRQNWLDYKTALAPDESDSFAMQGATTDILSADSDSIYMRHMRFDRQLVQTDTKRPHLFSTSSLLDDQAPGHGARSRPAVRRGDARLAGPRASTHGHRSPSGKAAGVCARAVLR
jgi:hypothetical protein